MIKKILISVVFLLVVAGGGVYFYFDSLVKSGIEVVGSSVLGVPVTVEGVSLSPLNGQGVITGLRVGNPEGFEAEYAFELASVAVNINASSVMTDVVEVESVLIEQPIITYETRITTDNIRALLANLPDSGGETSESEVESASNRQLIIRDFQMLEPELNFVSAVVSAPMTLPDIRMQNIGAESGAASAANALRVILQELVNSILRTDLPSFDLLRESVEDRVEEAVEDIGGRLRNILN